MLQDLSSKAPACMLISISLTRQSKSGGKHDGEESFHCPTNNEIVHFPFSLHVGEDEPQALLVRTRLPPKATWRQKGSHTVTEIFID
jgi:hypothetical protein